MKKIDSQFQGQAKFSARNFKLRIDRRRLIKQE